MKYDEAVSAILAMPENEHAVVLGRLIVSLTSYARRYYRGRLTPDSTSLANLNEILHSIGGYLMQLHSDPSILNPRLFFQTLAEKSGSDTDLKSRIVETLESCLAHTHAVASATA